MPNERRRIIGRVVSDKMDKTVVVMIERRKLHPVYKKVVRIRKKVMAHDETNSVKVGSLVRIVESRPLSKNKRWVVEQVLEAASGDDVTLPSAEKEIQSAMGKTGEEQK